MLHKCHSADTEAEISPGRTRQKAENVCIVGRWGGGSTSPPKLLMQNICCHTDLLFSIWRKPQRERKKGRKTMRKPSACRPRQTSHVTAFFTHQSANILEFVSKAERQKDRKTGTVKVCNVHYASTVICTSTKVILALSSIHRCPISQ